MIVGKPGTVLLDFDGVISPNASELLLTALHGAINRHTPVPFETTALLFKAITTFPARAGLGMVFDGLGLGGQFAAESAAIWQATDVDGVKYALGEGIREFCEGRTIRVCSTMDSSTPRRAIVVGLFGDADFLPIGHRSKADPATFTALQEELGELPRPWVLVDDSPLALRAAKLAGLTTVLMRGTVFNVEDTAPFATFIDAEVSSFAELAPLLETTEVSS